MLSPLPSARLLVYSNYIRQVINVYRSSVFWDMFTPWLKLKYHNIAQ